MLAAPGDAGTWSHLRPAGQPSGRGRGGGRFAGEGAAVRDSASSGRVGPADTTGGTAVPPPDRRVPLRPQPTRRRQARRALARHFCGLLALAALPGCAATDLMLGTARLAAETGTAVTGAARGAAGGVARLGDLTPAGVRQAAADFVAPDGPFRADRRDYLLGEPHPEPTIAHATGIAEPACDPPINPVAVSEGPVRVDGLAPVGDARGVWDLSLDEAVKITLQRTEVVREQNQFGSTTNPLLSAPLAVVSVFDPAIQETGVGFNRGPEAALADFDAQFTTSLVGVRNEEIQNNQFVVGQDEGDTLISEDVQFQSRLTKQFATGGSASFFHDVNKSFNNANGNLFPSFYRTTLGVDFRQPLLAGAGTRFNRIAGPNARNNRFLGNLDQGVLIARINTDQTVADFEREVRNHLRDVERAYWDLAAAYHTFDAEVKARGALLEIYRNVRVRSEEQLTGGGTADLAQALDAYRDAQFRTETARAQLLRGELALRRLMNLPVNDGRIIRPADDPVLARFTPDWRASLSGALVNRVELRRQKWEITRLALQLEAAHNAARPQLDVVSGYRVNGFGDQLLSRGVADETGGTLNSSYNLLADGNQTGYSLGLELAMPVGFRAAKVQVQNLELRLAKARSTLAAQEHEISHELAVAFQTVAEQYALATVALNRRRAAVDRVEAFEALQDTAAGDLDLLLRSEVSLAQAETQYWQAVYAYNQAIADVFLRQGTLLERDGVFLAEGDWAPGALADAEREAWDRANALDAPRLNVDPLPFARPESPAVPLPDANGGVDLPPSLVPGPGPGGVAPPPVPLAPADEPRAEIAPAPAPLPFGGDADEPAEGDGPGGLDEAAPFFPLPPPEPSPGDRGTATVPEL